MISAKRTGAAGGTAMQLCAREGAEVLTICGAGAAGQNATEAAMLVRPNLKSCGSTTSSPPTPSAL